MSVQAYIDQFIGELTGTRTRKIVNELEEQFAQLPHLPKSWVNYLVRAMPFLAMLALAIAVLQILLDLDLLIGGLTYPDIVFTNFDTIAVGINLVLQTTVALLLYRSLDLLQKRQLVGWLLLFWVVVINLIMMLVDIVFGAVLIATILILIESVLMLYLLFEVKSEYRAIKVEVK